MTDLNVLLLCFRTKMSEQDMLLFSVWDVRNGGPSVIPLPTPNEESRNEADLNCKRNCNDCAVHGDFTPIGTGVKCFYNLPRKLEEGDELTLKIERESGVQGSNV